MVGDDQGFSLGYRRKTGEGLQLMFADGLVDIGRGMAPHAASHSLWPSK